MRENLASAAIRWFSFLSYIAVVSVAPIYAFTSSQPSGNQTWKGIMETAGLWGSMELNVVRNGSQLKADCSFDFAGNQIRTPVLGLTEQGANTTFSTEFKVTDVQFTLNFRGRRDGKNLSGSLTAVRVTGPALSELGIFSYGRLRNQRKLIFIYLLLPASTRSGERRSISETNPGRRS
jgi:hypothetical protein